MKKYIVKYKDSNKTFGEYTSKEEASDKVMEYIHNYGRGHDHYISPFDFELEEVECKDVSKVITNFESARKALGGKPNADFTVSKKKLSKNVVQLEDVARLVFDINPKHLEALIALNELFTIAEAWNKADGFVPNFNDCAQEKWFPWFDYTKHAARFVYTDASFTVTFAHETIGSRLCFKTRERAEQFGKQFADLYNKVFL